MPYGRKRSTRSVGRVRHRVHHHKRRRIGAAGPKGQLVTHLLAAGAGALIGRFGSDKIMSFLPATMTAQTKGYIKAAVLAVGGGFLAWKMRNPIVRGLGTGLFVEGVHSFGQTMGWVSGVGRVDPASLVFPQGAKVGNYYDIRRGVAGPGGTNFPKPNTVGAHRRPAVSVMGGM